MRWCDDVLSREEIENREFCEGLGRLVFSAGILTFARPFLGPLYAWAAVAKPSEVVPVPPMTRLVLQWISEGGTHPAHICGPADAE